MTLYVLTDYFDCHRLVLRAVFCCKSILDTMHKSFLHFNGMSQWHFSLKTYNSLAKLHNNIITTPDYRNNNCICNLCMQDRPRKGYL